MPLAYPKIPLQILIFLFVSTLIFVFLLFGFPIQNTIVLFLATVVFVIAFLNTNIALIIIIISMLLSPEIQAGRVATRTVNLRVEDIFIFVVFFGWLARMAIRKELGLLRKNPLNAPIIIYFTICVVSTLLALLEGKGFPKDAFFYLLKYFEYYLIFFMVTNNLHSVFQAKVFVYTMLITCFIVCAIAWTQIPTGQRLSAPFESEGGEPNTFAGYLNLMMALIIAFAIYAKTLKMRLVWIGFFFFAFVPFLYTLSREGWISFIPLLFAFIVLNKRARAVLILFSLTSFVFLPPLLPKHIHKRAQDTFAKEKSYKLFGRKIYVSESTADRIEAWKKAMVKIRRKPILGRGVPGGSVIDNQYTRVLTETGLVGFTSFMWIIILLFRFALRTYRQTEDDFIKAISLGFLGGFVALLFQGLGAAVFILIRIMEPFWFLAALVLTLPEVKAEERMQLLNNTEYVR
ncbi:MAG: O-antigen ligase family protein [Candidatus Omnitrophica bacterium]|nr:O-antigen ligase family protein [Candidatus Omnitrophota bacterium]